MVRITGSDGGEFGRMGTCSAPAERVLVPATVSEISERAGVKGERSESEASLEACERRDTVCVAGDSLAASVRKRRGTPSRDFTKRSGVVGFLFGEKVDRLRHLATQPSKETL